MNAELLVTNDVAELLPGDRFRNLDQRDNVVCSGGIKLQIEDIERRLMSLGVDFQITAVTDERLGEAITLLYEAETDMADILDTQCRTLLGKYEVPRHYIRVEKLPRTETGKPARSEARRLAALMCH